MTEKRREEDNSTIDALCPETEAGLRTADSAAGAASGPATAPAVDSTDDSPASSVADPAADSAAKQPLIRKSDVLKFAGLIGFFAVSAVIIVLLWPSLHSIFEEDGLDNLIADVKSAGPWGVVILLFLQFIQVVVAFIPGEITQVAAGLIYGPWLGALIIIVGCVLSSAVVYLLVHKLGTPFVHDLVGDKFSNKFKRFEESGKLEKIVFILFLIPGLPKDTFTYLVPLTEMPIERFLLLSNVARLPGIILSTYAANGLMEGDWIESAIIFALLAVVALLGILLSDKIMKFLEARHHS